MCKKTLKRFLMVLDEAVVLLVEMKSRPGVTAVLKHRIDETIEELQRVSRDLSLEHSKPARLKLATKAVEKAIELWQRYWC